MVKMAAAAGLSAVYAFALMWAVRYSGHPHIVILAAQVLLLLPAAVVVARGKLEGKGGAWPLGALLGLYVMLGLGIGWVRGTGPAIPADESAWSFQARIFASGQLATVALPDTSPDPRVNCSERFFEWNILNGKRWFTQYPPGWPAVLAVGHLLGVGWLVSPVLGLVLLWLTARLGDMVLKAGSLAAALAVLSPYFVFNCVGYLSHACCAVLVAVGLWCLFRQRLLSEPSGTLWIGMFASMGAAFLVRPGTGAAAGLVLTAAGAWLTYERKWQWWWRFLGPAVVFGGGTVLLYVGYNLGTTGSVWETPYRLFDRLYCYRQTVAGFGELVGSFKFAQWGLQATQVFTVPLLFVLAAFGAWAGWKKGMRFEVGVLVGLYAAIFAVHLLVPTPSASTWGERYHFEAFAGLCLLGVMGWQRVREQWGVSDGSAMVLGVGLVAVQAVQFVVLGAPVLEGVKMQKAVRELGDRMDRGGVVVFLDPDTTSAKHMNMNEGAWWKAPRVFLVDPGEARRAFVMRAMGREEYVVLWYDKAAREAKLGEVVKPDAEAVGRAFSAGGRVRELERCACGSKR